jgi:hypothetical protein
MLTRYFAYFLLMADNRPSVGEKLFYWLNVIVAAGPVAYGLNELTLWFGNNQQFVRFVTIALLLNLVVGGIYHKKAGSFSWELFLKRNSVMILVIIVVYTLLEQLRLTAGENWAGETFRIVIQMATLLYPTSKVLKNMYILSDRQHPPAFIMDRLYNFEKNGNLGEFFKGKPEDIMPEYPTENTPDHEQSN